MTYKIVPIVAHLQKNQTQQDLGRMFEETINKYAADGWQYVRTETLKTLVEGSKGCLGLGLIGASPNFYMEMHMIVFEK